MIVRSARSGRDARSDRVEAGAVEPRHAQVGDDRVGLLAQRS